MASFGLCVRDRDLTVWGWVEGGGGGRMGGWGWKDGVGCLVEGVLWGWYGVGVDLKVEADAHDGERGTFITLITDAPMALVVGT